MKIPLRVFRPVRTAVDGSFRESPPQLVATIWGEVSLPGREMEIGGVDINEDVIVGDIVEIEMPGNF